MITLAIARTLSEEITHSSSYSSPTATFDLDINGLSAVLSMLNNQKGMRPPLVIATMPTPVRSRSDHIVDLTHWALTCVSISSLPNHRLTNHRMTHNWTLVLSSVLGQIDL